MSYGDPNTPALPPPGWYTDPSNPALERWWAGPSWTEHVREVPPPVYQAPAATYAPPVPEPYQPMSGWSSRTQPYSKSGFTIEATSPNTVPIWLLATSPIVNGIVGGVVQVVVPANDLITSLAANLLWFGALLGLVLWDRSILTQRGLPAASWAWLFLTVIGYLIARRVVLKRAGVTHNAPGNVFAGIILFVLVSAVLVAVTFAAR